MPDAAADDLDDTRRAVSDFEDPVLLVARIAQSLPGLDAAGLERLAGALDELTEAVGLLIAVDEEQ
jgi:hypothetical protein